MKINYIASGIEDEVIVTIDDNYNFILSSSIDSHSIILLGIKVVNEGLNLTPNWYWSKMVLTANE